MLIHFYYPKRLTFSPMDYEDGLGGSEASLVLLAKSLFQLGHKVEVYNACWNPGIYDGVEWKGAWDIYKAPKADVLIHVRTKSSVIEKEAGTHIFWMLDDRVDGVLEFQRKYPKGFVVLASEAMRNRIIDAGYIGIIKKIFLPIDDRTQLNWNNPSNYSICVHSSMPNRGLKELLKIWPIVYKKVPNAKLYVTSGWELWGYTQEEAKDKWMQVMGDDYESDGVVFTGVLPKEKLYELLQKSRFCVIPSHFPEMFCISAAEAESCGRPLIVSDLEALSERVDENGNGYKIKGSISDAAVQNEFAEKMIKLFNEDRLVEKMGENSRIRSDHYKPRIISEMWEEIMLGE